MVTKLPMAGQAEAEATGTGTVLVTGTSGFLGAAIQRALSGERRVCAIPGRHGFASRLAQIEEPIEAIVHAGFTVDFGPAYGGESLNVANTRRVLEFAEARGVQQFVFLSAAGALGVSGVNRARSEVDLGTTDPAFTDYASTAYVQDKLDCEELLSSSEVPTASLYLTTVYGRGMPEATQAALRRLRGPNPVVLCPPGGTSYLALGDFLDALRVVLAERATGGFVISSGNVTYRDLLGAAARAQGVSWRKRLTVLPPEALSLIDVAQHLPLRLPAPAVLRSSFGFKYYSGERARRELGWRPRAGLESTLAQVLR